MTQPTRRTALILWRAPDTDGVAALARDSGLHPDVVRRLLALDALGSLADPAAPPARDAAARLARIARLRRDFGLNYAGAILASELIARIDALESALSRSDPAFWR